MLLLGKEAKTDESGAAKIGGQNRGAWSMPDGVRQSFRVPVRLPLHYQVDSDGLQNICGRGEATGAKPGGIPTRKEQSVVYRDGVAYQ